MKLCEKISVRVIHHMLTNVLTNWKTNLIFSVSMEIKSVESSELKNSPDIATGNQAVIEINS